ncbi:hypothetical protein Slin14017_G076660 [Septoria linicola]|nr:hypothetical protein Slin14017_G076660 [Septoria linicola]
MAQPTGSVARRGRGRPRRAPPSPPSSDSDQDSSLPASPLARLTKNVAGFWLRSRSSPPPSPTLRTQSPHSPSPYGFGDDEDEDTIIVASGRQTTPPPMASPASTQFVAETPLTHLLNQPQNHIWPVREQSEGAREMTITAAAASIADFATHPDPAIEIQRLRQSRNGLVQTLEASTADVKRLQAKLRVYAGDKAALTIDLERHQVEDGRHSADEDRSRKWRIMLAQCGQYLLGALMLLVALYFVWLWVNAPELDYIRRRRAEVLSG